jgi:phage terminase large subunit-like protein
VVNGKFPACKWVKLACKRHLDDLQKSKDRNYLYRFDTAKANKVCNFVELLPHIKGPKAGQRMLLERWQKFILCVAFGWVHKSSGFRRFRRAYTEVPRGNGKSTLCAPIGLYGLAAEGEGGAEIYSAATTRDQAKIVFQVAQQMARLSPGYRQRFGVQVIAHAIVQQATASRFEPLSADAHTLDGLNVHMAIVDELHAHRTRKVYDVLETATAKRPQSLLWVITTAGSDRSGICYEVRTYITKILENITQDDSTFGIIFSMDDSDDWLSPASWQKANPNWGISVMPDVVSQLAKKAEQMPSAANNFKTKHLDLWVSSDHTWMDIQKWKACADPTLKIEEFLGQDCIDGLDLASKLDLLAKVTIFWKDIDGKRHYYVFGTYWTPEARLGLTQNSQYQGWVLSGYLRTCPGETNDYDAVEEDIREDASRFQVLEVGHDPYQAVELVNHLGSDGIVMAEVAQNALQLSEPMKEVEAAVYDGRFHHNGDPVLEWAISNVVCHRDKNDNLFPTKERYENKIDPATALFTGMNRVMSPERADSGFTDPNSLYSIDL